MLDAITAAHAHTTQQNKNNYVRSCFCSTPHNGSEKTIAPGMDSSGQPADEARPGEFHCTLPLDTSVSQRHRNFCTNSSPRTSFHPEGSGCCQGEELQHSASWVLRVGKHVALTRSGVLEHRGVVIELQHGSVTSILPGVAPEPTLKQSAALSSTTGGQKSSTEAQTPAPRHHGKTLNNVHRKAEHFPSFSYPPDNMSTKRVSVWMMGARTCHGLNIPLPMWRGSRHCSRQTRSPALLRSGCWSGWPRLREPLLSGPPQCLQHSEYHGGS